MPQDHIAQPAVALAVQPAVDDDADVPARQCGRCRLMFDGDPTLAPYGPSSFWLCPPCRSRLLDSTGHSGSGRTGR
jgi:hypothetical protein